MLAVGFVAAALGFGWFLVVAVGLTWATVELFSRAKERPPEELDTGTLMAQSPDRARSAIGAASSDQLCSWWLLTGQAIRRTYLPSTLCSYAELRQAILDELTARDPDGVSRWLGDQPDRRDLRDYLHDHQT